MNPLQVARRRAQNRYRRIALAETAAEGPLQPRQVAARRRQRHVVEAEQCRIADAGLDIRQGDLAVAREQQRSEEHTSELQSLMRISYAVFCLKKKKNKKTSKRRHSYTVINDKK